MSLDPPRFPLFDPRHLIFRTPPEPIMSDPASGCTAKCSCSSRYTLSSISWTIRRVNKLVSTKIMVTLYANGVHKSMRKTRVQWNSRNEQVWKIFLCLTQSRKGRVAPRRDRCVAAVPSPSAFGEAALLPLHSVLLPRKSDNCRFPDWATCFLLCSLCKTNFLSFSFPRSWCRKVTLGGTALTLLGMGDFVRVVSCLVCCGSA